MAPEGSWHHPNRVALLYHALAWAIAFLIIPAAWLNTAVGLVPALIALALGAWAVLGPEARRDPSGRRRAIAQVVNGVVIVLLWHWLFGYPWIAGLAVAVWILLYPLAAGCRMVARMVARLAGDVRREQPAGRVAAASRQLILWTVQADRPLAVGLVGLVVPMATQWVFASLLPGAFAPAPAILVAVAGVALVGGLAVGPRLPWPLALLGIMGPTLAGWGLLLGASLGGPASGGRVAGAGLIWSLALTAFVSRIVWSRPRAPARRQLRDAVLALAVGGAALCVMRGFLSPNLQGGGDAKWYAVMLKDMVLQERAAGLPVWAGASEYQFNGAIYPLRVAPAFHYLGALLDLGTLRALPTVALLNLLILSVGLAAALLTYAVGKALAPGRPGAAALLAVLYLACPGVAGIAYNTDLYMSWTTVPFVAVALLLAAHTVICRSPRASAGLGLALGFCWWGHSPIAIWTTVVAAAVESFAIVRRPPTRQEWAALLLGAAIFLGIAAYPLGSVLFFPPEAGVKMVDLQRASPGTISFFLQSVFPAVLQPMNPVGVSLGNFQLGYGLWAVLLGAVALFWPRLDRAARAFAVVAFALIVLLTPLPGLASGLWPLVPALLRNITGNWVMNRLYLVLAAAVVVVGLRTLQQLPAHLYTRCTAALLVCTLWSFTEVRKFVRAMPGYATGVDSPQALLRAENTKVTSFGYLLFSQVPATFSHGVVAPELEYRFLATADLHPIGDGRRAAAAHGRPVATLDFVAAGGGAFLAATAPVHLQPENHYLFVLEPAVPPHPATGVLQLVGSSLFREYLLPDYGGTKAFGLGGEHTPAVAVWTSVPGGEDVSVRFVPQGMSVEQATNFARVQVDEYAAGDLPVEVEGWIPFRARVRAPEACWFESPRMFQDGYRAKVGGVPVEVRKSPEGMVMFPVPAGPAEVTLQFRPAAGLSALFFFSLLTMVTAAGWVGLLARKPLLAGDRGGECAG